MLCVSSKFLMWSYDYLFLIGVVLLYLLMFLDVCFRIWSKVWVCLSVFEFLLFTLVGVLV